MVELADTPDLGSGAIGLRVQVPSLAKVNMQIYIIKSLKNDLILKSGEGLEPSLAAY